MQDFEIEVEVRKGKLDPSSCRMRILNLIYDISEEDVKEKLGSTKMTLLEHFSVMSEESCEFFLDLFNLGERNIFNPHVTSFFIPIPSR